MFQKLHHDFLRSHSPNPGNIGCTIKGLVIYRAANSKFAITFIEHFVILAALSLCDSLATVLISCVGLSWLLSDFEHTFNLRLSYLISLYSACVLQFALSLIISTSVTQLLRLDKTMQNM